MTATKKTTLAPRRSIGARKNPHAEAAILDAALRLLKTKGPKGLTMDGVAREAQAGKATIYRWWPTRGALLIAVYERIKGTYEAADTGRFETDVADFFDHVFTFWQGDAGPIFALIIAQAQSDPDVAVALRAYREERIQDWLKVIARSEARGELTGALTSEQIAESIIALAWHQLTLGQLNRDSRECARMICQSVCVEA
jgi:AcrR family transcriptional regulator